MPPIETFIVPGIKETSDPDTTRTARDVARDLSEVHRTVRDASGTFVGRYTMQVFSTRYPNPDAVLAGDITFIVADMPEDR